MALPVDKLGTTYEERVEPIDPQRALAYAAATNDANEAYRSGKLAPPVFGVVPTWEAMSLAVADVVPAEALMMVVHGEQDMHFHQPLVPGRSLRTAAQAHGIRVGRTGTRFTILVRSSDADSGSQVLDQYVTMFIRGMSDGEGGGSAKPDHTFPEEARDARVGQHSVHVDEDQTYRYRDASGDQMPIHLDEEFAKSVGLPGIIAHGLCTMAMCSQAIVALGADGDPGRLARLAVRFGAFVLPGNDVVSTVYDAGRLDDREVYVFEAESGGRTVITNGRGEVRR